MHLLHTTCYRLSAAAGACCLLLCLSCGPSVPYPPEIQTLISEVKAAPGDTTRHEKLIKALCANKYYETGLAYADKLIGLAPGSPAGYLNAAFCSEELGSWDDAEGYLKKTCALEPVFPNAFLRLALLYYQKGAYADCERTILELLSSEPDRTSAPLPALILLAKSLYYKNDSAGAYRIIEDIMQYNFSNKDALYSFGLWKVRDAKYEEAIPALARYISLYPEDPIPYVLLGTAYYHSGKLPYAEEAFLKAASADPALKALADIIHLQKTESTYHLINTAFVKAIEEYHYKEGGLYRVRGIVESLGLEVAKEVSVVVQILDKKDAVIGQTVCETSPRNLRPQQYAFFQADFPYSKEIARATVKPNWEKRSARVTFE